MKKKNLLVALAVCCGLSAQASDYGYLSFRRTDGSQSALAVEGLKIVFHDGNLIATQGGETLTLDLASLSSMCFTSSRTSGIADISTAEVQVRTSNRHIQVKATVGDDIAVYSVDGSLLASALATDSEWLDMGTMPMAGLYVVSVNGVRTKLLVR